MKNCILVVNEQQKEIFFEFFQEQNITEVVHLPAKSYKHNLFLDLFHLSEKQKTVFWFLAQDRQVKKLEQLCNTTLTGKENGILIKLKKENTMTESNGKLIVTIIKSGFTELVTDAAQQFEVSGATIISGKGIGKSHSSFMGMGIDSEREIVLIAVNDQIAKQLQNQIKKSVIKNSAANGICFMLPLEDFVNFADKTENEL